MHWRRGIALAWLVGCSSADPICLSDSFDEPAIDALRWHRIGEAPIGIVDGELRLTAPLALSSAQTGISSNERIDLSGRSLAVRVPEVLPSDANTFAEMSIVLTDTVDALGIKQTNDTLVFATTSGSVAQEVAVPLDPQIDGWRIRDDASTASIVFETSQGGDTWTMQRTIPRPFLLAGVAVQLEVDVTATPTTAGTASFDDLVVDQGACTDASRYRDHDP